MSQEDESMHWADRTAAKLIELEDKDTYTCASGITPSGDVHIGNFREIITVELVVRALKRKGKKTRFLYSWDDFDTFRKVPKGMPQQEMLKSYLRQPIVDIPDPFGEESSYARHNEVMLEREMPKLGIFPEYIYQHTMYRDGKYADGIKLALKHTAVIKKIIDAYRKTPLSESWLPVTVFDPETNTDEITDLKWDGDETLSFVNKLGKSVQVNISEGKYIKLLWRIDWPMRWKHEGVDFEPGGKDHSSEGGSYTTAKDISWQVYGQKAPHYIMYDFVRIKGAGGKISSSEGGAPTVASVLKIYTPAVLRYLFAGTRPGTEFAISYDADVIKIYEDFDRCERIYFGKEDVDDKERIKQKRIYELSLPLEAPSQMPFQAGFRHLTVVAQLYEKNVEKILDHYRTDRVNDEDIARVEERLLCAIHWLETHAPDEFVFTVQDSVNDDVRDALSEQVKVVLNELVKRLSEEHDADFDVLGKEMYTYCKSVGCDPKEYFTAMYQILLRKSKGPRLMQFIKLIGAERVTALIKQAL